MKTKICILLPNKLENTETFLNSQINALRPYLTLSEGFLPSILPSGKSILPFPLSYHFVRGSFRNLLPLLYKRCYIYFLTCYVQHSVLARSDDSEGTPNSISEASAMLPVVSTFHAGIKQAVVHEQTGFLVDEGDSQAMGLYVLKLAENEELAQTLGENGRKHIKQSYTEQTWKQGLVKILATT